MKIRKFKTNHIYLGKCQDVMKDFPPDSVNLIVTDCPYGIAFMGKNWDKVLPSIDIWKECLRVLKPGAFAFIMSAPRQDVLARMIINLEDAGFVIGFSSIYHVYASGFPKAANISKIIDKKLGTQTIEYREPMGRIDRNKKPNGSPFKTNYNGESGKIPYNKPTSPQAKALDGSYAGFQPKPALEVVLVCMKPIESKTYSEQAMKNRHGITWLDDGRIPIENLENEAGYRKNAKNYNFQESKHLSGFAQVNRALQDEGFYSSQGRFPANLLVENDVLNDGKIYKASFEKGDRGLRNYGLPGSKRIGNGEVGLGYSDTGSFSRHFSLDAWWNGLIKQLPKSVQKTFPFMIIPKSSKAEKNKGLEGMEGEMRFSSQNLSGQMLPSKTNKPHKIKGNFHPTCKPIRLGCYLITIGSREGDIVLDPFVGSGTFCISATMLKRKHIGIDTDPEYVRIARARIRELYLEMISQ